MDNAYLLLFIGGLLGAALIAGIFIVSIPLAALIYVWKNVYPLVKRIAKWSARLENLMSLAVVTGILLFLIIILAWQVSILFIIFIIIPLILLIPIYLGVLVWIIRFIRRAYARWRIWLIVNYLRLRTGSSNRRPMRAASARSRLRRKK